jgi:hypothetical protein
MSGLDNSKTAVLLEQIDNIQQHLIAFGATGTMIGNNDADVLSRHNGRIVRHIA